jgi:hypothetical protein
MCHAQDHETEPNQPCAQAQNLGAIPLPYTLAGSLDSTLGSPDVDFFRFIGTPGALVRIDLEGATVGKGTLVDPYLGAFDSSCNLIAVNDDFQLLNSRLTLAIPLDGVLILGATSCCDGSFLGGGVGTYQLSVSYFVPVRSIGGRIVDAVTAEPLAGNTEAFGFVRLLRCESFGCSDINSQSAGSDGRFLFTRDAGGQFLAPGTYQIIATANEYEAGQTDQFEVFGGDDRDLGNVALQPFPVRFSDITPCTDVPAQGGKCRYSVRITNRLSTRLSGAAWSLVTGSGTGSHTDSTNFQTDDPKKMTLESLESKVVRFDFDVPGTVRAGAFICTQVFFGDDRREPLFNTVGQRFLFCITKSFNPTSAFSVAPSKDAQKNFRRSDGRMMAPPKAKSR